VASGLSAAILQAAAAAVALGTADFAGGLAARGRPAIQVAAIVQAIELVCLIGVLLVVRPVLPPTLVPLLGALAGLAGAFGLTALYRGLAVGPMGVVAGISAVGAVTIPIVFSAALGRSFPTPLQLVGVACAVAATLTASALPGSDIRRSSVAYAILAAAGFGAYILLIKAAANWGFWVLLSSRIAAVLVLGAIVVVRHREAVRQAGFSLLLLAGVFDLGGNALGVMALVSLPVGLVAAVTGTYPVATAVLAWVALHQRPRLGGYASIGLAVVGIVLIGQR